MIACGEGGITVLKSVAKTELDRALALDIVRVTEASAVSAALWRGRGNEVAAASYGVELVNPDVHDTGSKGAVVVAYFEDGWQVWGSYHP